MDLEKHNMAESLKNSFPDQRKVLLTQPNQEGNLRPTGSVEVHV